MSECCLFRRHSRALWWCQVKEEVIYRDILLPTTQMFILKKRRKLCWKQQRKKIKRRHFGCKGVVDASRVGSHTFWRLRFETGHFDAGVFGISHFDAGIFGISHLGAGVFGTMSFCR